MALLSKIVRKPTECRATAMYVGLTTTEMPSPQARISATGCVNYDVRQRHCQTGIENEDVMCTCTCMM